MAKSRVVRIRKDLPGTWEEALEQFLFWKQAEGLSVTTLNDYKIHLRRFFSRYPQAFQPQKVKTNVLKYMAQPVKPATYNLRLVYLKTFFAWCVRGGIFYENPLDGLKKRKDEGRVVNLDTDTIVNLINLPDRKTFAGIRDYALILLTLDTGIRPKEAFSLLKDDINSRSLEVYIRSEVAKTRVSRTLPIMPVTAQAIKELIQARHPAWKGGVPVFTTSEGTPLNRHTWGDRLEMYGKRLEAKIRPYDLRHAFAMQFLRNGGHALALQRTLGHTDLTMTKRYVALTEQDLRQQHTIASPLNVLLPQKHRVRKVNNIGKQ
jgi:site-specific recombinase XerD